LLTLKRNRIDSLYNSMAGVFIHQQRHRATTASSANCIINNYYHHHRCRRCLSTRHQHQEESVSIESSPSRTHMQHGIWRRLQLRQKMPQTSLTGQSIPPARLYPGLKQPMLDYTRVYYGLGQFITPQAKIYPHDIITTSIVLSYIPKNYFLFSKSYWGFGFVR